MIIEANEDQIKNIAAKAINASIPVGLGRLHFEDREYLPREIEIQEGKLHLDYVGGRLVKIYFERKEDGTWKVNEGCVFDEAPVERYQSWIKKYPTYEALFEGIL